MNPNLTIIFSSPTWSLSGVNVAVANLIRELVKNKVDARFLLTDPARFDSMPMPATPDIPVDILSAKNGPKAHYRAMLRYLKKMAPCVYVPGYDWDHSGVCPVLFDDIIVVGVVHSDDPAHYEHVKRLGKYWNAIVCVSQTIAENTYKIDSLFKPRICVIPSGVAVPDIKQKKIKPGAPLKIIYTGRIIQHQKRIMDLARIVNSLEQKKIDFRLTITGNGPQYDELKKALARATGKGLIKMIGTIANDEVIRQLPQHDAFVLTSDFEGAPVSLLEAMAAGCVPVVTDIKSGIPELVEHGVNGFRVPVGDIRDFANKFELLFQNPDLRKKMSEKSRAAIINSRYSIKNVTQQYIEIFESTAHDVKTGVFVRPKGKILPLPSQNRGMALLKGLLRKL